MNIYIPIEIKSRELESRALLACVAAERGHLVILGEKADTRGLCKKGALPPGILHEKSLTPSESTIRYFGKLKKDGYLITSQDEESGLTTEEYDHFARGRFSSDTLRYTSKVFGWGAHDTESIRRIYPQFSEKIVDTGSPRVDLWRKDFEAFFHNPEADIPEINKPYILIPTNFSFLLGEDRIWNIFARMRNAGYFDRDPNRELYDYYTISYRIKLLGHFVQMIRFLSVQFPELSIIVRPHPIEVTDAWSKMIGDFPNVSVIRQGSASAWIRHAELLVNNGCTTALEAAVAGIPRIAYRPVTSDYEDTVPNEVAYRVSETSELKEIVTLLLKKKDPPQAVEINKRTLSVLEKRFSNLSETLAADRIVDEWESIVHPVTGMKADLSQLMAVKNSAETSSVQQTKRKLSAIKNSVFTSSGKSKKKPLLFNPNKFPDFTDGDMERILTGFKRTLNRFNNVRYERFGEKSFLLYSSV